MAGQWAMVCILVAELSPLCWLHHLVLAMPAMLLFAQMAAPAALLVADRDRHRGVGPGAARSSRDSERIVVEHGQRDSSAHRGLLALRRRRSFTW